jgi:hypothetical protein
MFGTHDVELSAKTWKVVKSIAYSPSSVVITVPSDGSIPILRQLIIPLEVADKAQDHNTPIA